jgi:hypothetical protein
VACTQAGKKEVIPTDCLTLPYPPLGIRTAKIRWDFEAEIRTLSSFKGKEEKHKGMLLLPSIRKKLLKIFIHSVVSNVFLLRKLFSESNWNEVSTSKTFKEAERGELVLGPSATEIAETIILPVVLYRCETWSPPLRLRVLRRI